jgi:putative SOS response-associated peptidase YedK
MCGRFSLGTFATTLARQCNLADLLGWSPRYNIAPTQQVLTVLRTPDDSEPHFALLRWGLIPMWAEGPAVGFRMINARAETVVTKPAVHRAFREQRRLVLVDGLDEE